MGTQMVDVRMGLWFDVWLNVLWPSLARVRALCTVDNTHNRIKGTDRDLNGRCFTALYVKLKLSTASALTGGVSADFPRSWPCASCLASATEASARHTKMTALLITMLLLLAWCYFWVVGRSVGEGEKERVCEDKNKTRRTPLVPRVHKPRCLALVAA